MNQDINSIIYRLAEIDSASAKIMQKDQKEKSHYAEYIHYQKQRFDKTLKEKIDKEIEAFQTFMNAQNEKETAQYKIDCDKDITNLEQLFKENGNQWADEVFNNIIK